jgi:hypothetical protein
MRRLSVLGGALGALAAALLLRRRATARRERVDVYYADGSMLSLDGGDPDAQALLTLARSAFESSGAGS